MGPHRRMDGRAAAACKLLVLFAACILRGSCQGKRCAPGAPGGQVPSGANNGARSGAAAAPRQREPALPRSASTDLVFLEEKALAPYKKNATDHTGFVISLHLSFKLSFFFFFFLLSRANFIYLFIFSRRVAPGSAPWLGTSRSRRRAGPRALPEVKTRGAGGPGPEQQRRRGRGAELCLRALPSLGDAAACDPPPRALSRPRGAASPRGSPHSPTQPRLPARGTGLRGAGGAERLAGPRG